MKKVLIIAIIFATLSSCSNDNQDVPPIDQYFKSIRNNGAELTAFFSMMPKGGDLHNHYSGSVYAETYINYVVDQNDVINEQTLEVRTTAPTEAKGWVRFSRLSDSGLLAAYKEKLIQK